MLQRLQKSDFDIFACLNSLFVYIYDYEYVIGQALRFYFVLFIYKFKSEFIYLQVYAFV